MLDENNKKISAQGNEGEGRDGVDGKDGKDGRDGTDGQDGQDGADGITPRLKIESDFWYISYDEGDTWSMLGRATGNQGEQGIQGPQGNPGAQGPQGNPGPQGEKGEKGDSFFSMVNLTEDSVTFTLTSGESFTIPIGEEQATLEFTVEGKQQISVANTLITARINVDFSLIESITTNFETQDAIYTKAAGGWKSIISVDKHNKLIRVSVSPDPSVPQVLFTITLVLKGGEVHKISKILYTELDLSIYAIDLSEDKTATANCYVVPFAGNYKIPTVQGNTIESVGEADNAVVIWESFGNTTTPSEGDLISDISYKDGYISFTASHHKGNALIAARNGDTILWSWHIWMTDPPKDQLYKKVGMMLDRNLGATSPYPEDKERTVGLLYQYGRKDPFLGPGSVEYSEWTNFTPAATTITFPDPITSTEVTGTILYATQHPTTFINGNELNNDWYYTGDNTYNDTRWRRIKTIYDPCPAGYVIPYNDSHFGIWSETIGGTASGYGEKKYGIDMGSSASIPFTLEPLCWYPFTGKIESPYNPVWEDSGTYWSYNSNDWYYISSSPDRFMFTGFRFSSTSFGFTNVLIPSTAHAVRCEKIRN